jgi:hypothetical protein
MINNKLLHPDFGRFFIFDIQKNEIIWPGLDYRFAQIAIFYRSYFPKRRFKLGHRHRKP